MGNGFANCFVSDPRALLAHARTGRFAFGYLKVSFRLADGAAASPHCGVNLPAGASGGNASPVPADLAEMASLEGLRCYVRRRLVEGPGEEAEKRRGTSAGAGSASCAGAGDAGVRSYMVRGWGARLLLPRHAPAATRPHPRSSHTPRGVLSLL